jgi:hypothetical protein
VVSRIQFSIDSSLFKVQNIYAEIVLTEINKILTFPCYSNDRNKIATIRYPLVHIIRRLGQVVFGLEPGSNLMQLLVKYEHAFRSAS